MNGCASCFSVLWAAVVSKVEGGERSRGQHVIFDLFPCTISLSLYISFTWCHAWIAPWPPNPPTTTTTSSTPPSSSLLVCLCRPTPWLRLPLKPPHVPSGCRDLLMAVWVWKQRSNSRTRALSVRDDEEGHLICRSGDVLQERCTHCHYSIVTLLHMNINE